MEPEKFSPFLQRTIPSTNHPFSGSLCLNFKGGGSPSKFQPPCSFRWQNLALRSAGKRRCLEQDMLPVAMKLMEQLGLEEFARQRHGQLDLPPERSIPDNKNTVDVLKRRHFDNMK